MQNARKSPRSFSSSVMGDAGAYERPFAWSVRMLVCFMVGFLFSVWAMLANAMLVIDVVGGGSGPVQVGADARPGGVQFVCNPYDPTDCPVANNKLLVNPKTPLPVPSGWGAAVPPAVQPVPPSTVPLLRPEPQIAYYTNKNAACLAMPINTVYRASEAVGVKLWKSPSSGGALAPASMGPWSIDSSCVGSPSNFNVYISGASDCPSGYSVSGSTCSLSNASIVAKPSDGSCQIIRSGNTFSGDVNDPDCSVNPGVTVTGAVQTIKPNPVKPGQCVTTTDAATGVTTIACVTTNITNNTTTTTTYTLGAPNGVTGIVKITGIAMGTVSGTGAGAGGAPISEFPSDYNKESTQQSIKTAVEALKDKQCGGAGQAKCEVKIDETGTPIVLDSWSAPQIAELNSKTPASFGIEPYTGSSVSIFSGFPSLPSGTDGCVNPVTMNLLGRVITPDLCAIWGPFKPWFSWLLYALTGVYIWRRSVYALGA